MTTVNLLPDTPLLPLFIAVSLAAAATQRTPAWSAGSLGLIVFTTIIYQLTGFMIWSARNTIGVILIITVAAALLTNFLSATREPTSTALAILAVATMLTPYYYLSVALITAATATGEEKRMWPMSITYTITLAPLLILENGLSTTNTAEAGPTIFAQLVNLVKYMRPPLTSLNVFLPGATTSGFRDPDTAQPILSYLSGTRVFELITPLTTLALIFSLTATTAGLTTKTLKRLATIDDSTLTRTLTPIIISIITPLMFAVLLNSLSPRYLGGYQTTLQAQDTLYMILGSLILGAAYTWKEYATNRLEKTEKTRINLQTRLKSLRKIMDENGKLLTLMQQKTPLIDLAQEKKANEEAATTHRDITNGIQTADRHTLEKWTSQVDEASHLLNRLPEMIRLKIITELNTLINYTRTYGEALKETGITEAFGKWNTVKGDATMEEAIADYTQLTQSIERDVNRLYTTYRQTQKAYNEITARPDTPPPVDPTTLLEANDAEAALRLVVEEYWLRYHNGAQHELERNTATLLESAKRFREQTTDNLEEIIGALESPKSVNAPDLLIALQALKTAIDTTLKNIESEDERLHETMRGITPTAHELLGSPKMLPMRRIEQLRQRNEQLPPTLTNTSKLLEETTIIIRSYREEARRNEENLIIAAHYPEAKRTIEAQLREHVEAYIHELPYAENAAHIYAQLYVRDSPATEYDEEAGELRTRDRMQ